MEKPAFANEASPSFTSFSAPTARLLKDSLAGQNLVKHLGIKWRRGIHARINPELGWKSQRQVRLREPAIRVSQICRALNDVRVSGHSIERQTWIKTERNAGGIDDHLLRDVRDRSVGTAHHHPI